MKKLAILTLAISFSGVGQAFANLPDEINYTPYQNQYEVLSANVDQITSELTRAEDDLSQAYSDEQLISEGIVEYEDANRSIRTDISSSNSNLSQLRSNERDLEDRVDQLNRRVDKLTREERQLARQIRDEDSRIQPIRERLKKVNQRLKVARAEMDRAQSLLNRAKSELNSAESQLASLRSQKQTLKRQLENQKAQLASIDNQISVQNSNLSQLPGKISSAENSVSSANQELRSMSSELAAQRTELTDLMRTSPDDPKIRELRVALAAKARVVAAQRQVVKQNEAALLAVKAQQTNIERAISNLENQKRSLPSTISNTESAISSNQNQIDSNKSEVKVAIVRVSSEESNLSNAQAAHSQVENRVSTIRDNLERESRSLDRLINERREVEARLSEVANRANARESDLVQTRSEIRSLENHIPELERSLRSNEMQISKLKNDLRVVQDDIVAANRSVNELEREQSIEISKRDNKYQDYISRFNFYNENLDDAKELGSSQIGPANGLAIKASNTYVQNRSSALGSSMGMMQAQVEANFWGSVRAELKGHSDGYQLGLISEADIERGESEGAKAGVENANTLADQVLKPRFFNEIFEAKIANSLSGVDLLKASKLSAPSVHLVELSVSKIFSFSNSVEPVTESELQSSMNLVTPLDEPIASFNNNYSQTITEVEQMSVPANAFEAPSNIPFGTPSCSNVYKGVAEFKTACKQSYSANFEDTYRTVFYQNFESQYLELYSNVLEAKRDSKIEGLYKASYAKHYVTAENAGISDGKNDIFEKTYKLAKDKAYSESLPVATARVKEEATTEVKDWIALNPTLTLSGSKIEGSKLRGNTKAKLVISVKNISPKDLEKPVKVVITNLVNANIAQKEFFLKVAPGSKTSEFREIEFTIASSARSNEQIKISGELILPGGKYKAQRSERFSATAMTAVNPAISTKLQFDSTPQVVTSVRRRTLIHNLDTSISPSVESVNQGYVVSLKTAPGFTGMINFKNTSFNTGRISYGRSQNIRFQYTFPRSSEDKIVKVIATYTYDGEVVKTDLIELRPH